MSCVNSFLTEDFKELSKRKGSKDSNKMPSWFPAVRKADSTSSWMEKMGKGKMSPS